MKHEFILNNKNISLEGPVLITPINFLMNVDFSRNMEKTYF